MEHVQFEVKSEATETDKSSSVGSPLSADSENKLTRKSGGPRCKYGKPSKEDRQALIHRITHEGLSIRQAARKAAINYSTAKSIYNLYKNEGRLGNDLAKDDEEESVETPSVQTIEKPVQAENSWFTTQFPLKKQFQSQEKTIERKDPFTCLLYQQLNNVENKPRGFFTTDALGSQTKALLSSAFCVYTPPSNTYSNVIVAPNYNQQNQMIFTPRYY